MRFIDSNTKDLLLHAIRHFVVAIAVFGFAAVLDIIEIVFRKWQLSSWLTDGIDLFAKFLFYTEGFVICFIVVFGGIHSIRNIIYRAKRQNEIRRKRAIMQL
jgi:hypothetical protein